MKRLIPVILLGFACVTDGFARDNSLLARITVYWAGGGRGSDRYTCQHKSSTGLRLQQGHCAVDPRRIPYGSRVVLPDGATLSAVDTGTAVRNRKAARRLGRTPYERNAIVIDKFFETKRQAMAWANSNPPFVNVKVIPPNVAPVAKPNLTNSQPTALNPPAIANTVASSGPSGGAIKNPLGRLGR